MGSLLTSFRRASRVRSRIIYKNESVPASQVNMRSKNILTCDLGRVHPQPESVRPCSFTHYARFSPRTEPFNFAPESAALDGAKTRSMLMSSAPKNPFSIPM